MATKGVTARRLNQVSAIGGHESRRNALVNIHWRAHGGPLMTDEKAMVAAPGTAPERRSCIESAAIDRPCRSRARHRGTQHARWAAADADRSPRL
jgi:hypothetical protein